MAKTLTIKFKGASNLAYLSLFPGDLFDQIDTIKDADFNVSDLSAFAVSESIIGKGLQWDSLEVSASLDGDQIYLGELLREYDRDSEQILGPSTGFADADGQEAEEKIAAAIFSDSHRCKYALVDLSLMDEFIAALDGFYDSGERDTGPRTYVYFTENDGVWLLADTTRDYVGDYQSLVEQAYLYTSDDGIYWTNCASIH